MNRRTARWLHAARARRGLDKALARARRGLLRWPPEWGIGI